MLICQKVAAPWEQNDFEVLVEAREIGSCASFENLLFRQVSKIILCDFLPVLPLTCERRTPFPPKGDRAPLNCWLSNRFLRAGDADTQGVSWTNTSGVCEDLGKFRKKRFEIVQKNSISTCFKENCGLLTQDDTFHLRFCLILKFFT